LAAVEVHADEKLALYGICIYFYNARGDGRMQFDLMASMMCANYGNLEQEVKDLEAGGIDSFHIDIMDGRYVPNFAMSLNDMRYIANATSKPLDVHLMIEHPSNNIGLFLKNLRQCDTVYIHPEAEYHPSTTLQAIINAGMTPGIAVNPGTSVETIMEMLRIVKKVLVMSVNPGNAGQMYLPYVGKKITKLLALKEDMDFEIYWDGACSAEKILEFAPKGVRGFVLGTTLLFGKKQLYGETLQNIRELKF
jgi:ribulose-phosphate 3-epimerase